LRLHRTVPSVANDRSGRFGKEEFLGVEEAEQGELFNRRQAEGGD